MAKDFKPLQAACMTYDHRAKSGAVGRYSSSYIRMLYDATRYTTRSYTHKIRLFCCASLMQSNRVDVERCVGE